MVLHQVVHHSHARHKTRVKYGARPRVLPFAGAIVRRVGPQEGTVFLERRDDKLYLDGREIVLATVGRLYPDKTFGQVKECLPAGDLLCDLVLDALFQNPSLIPECWAVNEQGEPRFIYFLNGVFADSRGREFAPYLFRSGGKWSRHVAPLKNVQVHPFDYAARLKSAHSLA